MAAKEETVFSFQEIVGGHNLRFQTKDRSKSVEITDTASSVQYTPYSIGNMCRVIFKTTDPKGD